MRIVCDKQYVQSMVTMSQLFLTKPFFVLITNVIIICVIVVVVDIAVLLLSFWLGINFCQSNKMLFKRI